MSPFTAVVHGKYRVKEVAASTHTVTHGRMGVVCLWDGMTHASALVWSMCKVCPRCGRVLRRYTKCGIAAGRPP